MLKYVCALLAVVFAAGASAAGYPCYGPAEKKLAEELLRKVPGLRMKLVKEERESRQLRRETCGTIWLTGALHEIDYAFWFFDDTGYRPIWVAAEARELSTLKVQAAMVDALWPPPKRTL
jgi:hypothetical protein